MALRHHLWTARREYSMDQNRYKSRVFWKVIFLAFTLLTIGLPSGAALAQVGTGDDDGGSATFPYPHAGAQLMQTFTFFFLNGDHRINRIEVWPDASPGQATVAFQDFNLDDDYSYYIE